MNESNATKKSYWLPPSRSTYGEYYTGLCVAHNNEEMEQCVHFAPGSFSKYICLTRGYNRREVHTVCSASLEKLREEGAAV